MPGALIIGYGNPLRGDDGLGPRAADLLGGMVLHQLNPELAEPISRAGLVIFIDAAETGRPGEWTCVEVRPAPSAERLFTHHLDPGALLAAARALYGRAPRALLFTMAGESFDLGEELSPAVAAALPELVKAIKAATAGRSARSHRS